MPQMLKNTISLQGKVFEYAVSGQRSPAIVLINGAGGPLEGWSKIWGKAGNDHLCFCYNRPGIGKSSRPNQAQTGLSMVEDLKALLFSLKIDPPYLLIGHSLGGFIVQLYTRMYPEEVCGVVFLESATIKDVTESKHQQKMRGDLMEETHHVLTTIRQIEACERFPDIPIQVVAGSRPAFGWLMPKERKEARKSNQLELHELSGKGAITMANKSGHFPQLTEPDVVLQVINNLLNDLSKA